jgi:hypothetical protein
MEAPIATNEQEMLYRVERMLRLQNAAAHLEIMMLRARELQTETASTKDEQEKVNT